MERPVKGDVVVLPFPFSDLTATKKRPALVVSALAGQDFIGAQISSQPQNDSHALPLTKQDFTKGGLLVESNIRPNKLFTADFRIILYKAGRINDKKLWETKKKICAIIQQ